MNLDEQHTSSIQRVMTRRRQKKPKPKAAPRATSETIAVLGPGETFGEGALVDNRQHSASVRTLTFCDLSTLSVSDFEVVVQRFPVLKLKIRALQHTRDKALAEAALKLWMHGGSLLMFHSPSPSVRLRIVFNVWKNLMTPKSGGESTDIKRRGGYCGRQPTSARLRKPKEARGSAPVSKLAPVVDVADSSSDDDSDDDDFDVDGVGTAAKRCSQKEDPRVTQFRLRREKRILGRERLRSTLMGESSSEDMNRGGGRRSVASAGGRGERRSTLSHAHRNTLHRAPTYLGGGSQQRSSTASKSKK